MTKLTPLGWLIALLLGLVLIVDISIYEVTKAHKIRNIPKQEQTQVAPAPEWIPLPKPRIIPMLPGSSTIDKPERRDPHQNY